MDITKNSNLINSASISDKGRTMVECKGDLHSCQAMLAERSGTLGVLSTPYPWISHDRILRVTEHNYDESTKCNDEHDTIHSPALKQSRSTYRLMADIELSREKFCFCFVNISLNTSRNFLGHGSAMMKTMDIPDYKQSWVEIYELWTNAWKPFRWRWQTLQVTARKWTRG